MQLPALNDTIVAVSTAWGASAVGVVRLSGPDAHVALVPLGIEAPPAAQSRSPCSTEGRLSIEAGLELPATLLWFWGPRSYTGQDTVEMHIPGNPFLLRLLCDRLTGAGVRRALPGEFTARAFLNGKMDASAVEDVYAAIHAGSRAAERAGYRLMRHSQEETRSRLHEELADLLARVEAGIDFVEEEDVRFISAEELRASLERIGADVRALAAAQRRMCASTPHVALVGRPNAGKSTLFNALIGSERAIVSPVVGTTRDVLCACVRMGDLEVTLQDCAGLGESTTEIEVAAHRAAEGAIDQADLVLWVHPRGESWTPSERQALLRTDPERRILVLSKCDSTAAVETGGNDPSDGFHVSAWTGSGLDALKAGIRRHFSHAGLGADEMPASKDWARVESAVGRASSLVEAADAAAGCPELLAFELREALTGIRGTEAGTPVEDVLGRIFARFCVGK